MRKTIPCLLAALLFASIAHAASVAPSKPQVPGDNDTLIKQYMDTKDPIYLETMLGAYAEASDAMLTDARRYAFLLPLSQAPKNPRPNINQTAARVLCAKYECGTKPLESKPFVQLMTIASGMWALDSLSQQDPAIRTIVNNYLGQHPRMQKIYASEGLQFSNYKTLVVVAAIDPNKVDSLLTLYEEFQPLDMKEVQQRLNLKPPAP